MKKWIFFTMVLLFSFLIWQGYVFIQNLLEPQKSEAEEALNVIRNSYNIKTIHDIEPYAGLSKSYQVADVTTEANNHVYIWYSKKDNETYIINANEGITKQKALDIVNAKEKPKKVIRITPGLEGNSKNRIPVWEVVFEDQNNRYTFYYVDFRTGDYLQSYRLNKAS